MTTGEAIKRLKFLVPYSIRAGTIEAEAIWVAVSELERLRSEVERLTRERDANAAEVDRLGRELVTLRNRAGAAGLDESPAGACDWPHCPQFRDGEPERSGRHCPLDVDEDA